MRVGSSLFIIHLDLARRGVMLDTKKSMNEYSSSTTEMIVHGSTVRLTETE